jgi:arylsulfatase A-like enzyme
VTRPNIVVIVTDDMGYGDIGLHGSRDIPTPNIDALMTSGTRFTDAYVSGAFCSPTRAGFLTGRYPVRFGYEFNLSPGPSMYERGLPLSETTLATRLKNAGYRTAIVGKWHLGYSERFHPLARGFDEFFGFLGGEHSYMDPAADKENPLLDGRAPVTDVAYLTDAFGDRAADFVRRTRVSPFFLYLAFNAVHSPIAAPEKYLTRFASITDVRRKAYAAALSAMDDAIGKTMAVLREQSLLENTLVVFFNDNGGPVSPPAVLNGSSNAPLRGSKRQTWEGGIRVPFAFSWKGQIPAGRVDNRPIIQLDVMPTALAAAGIPIDPSWQLDGVDLLPLLRGKSTDRPHESLYWKVGDNMAIRRGDWKLVIATNGPLQDGALDTIESLSRAELYNLSNDISESTNVAASQPSLVRALAEEWLRWRKEMPKPLWCTGRGCG